MINLISLDVIDAKSVVGCRDLLLKLEETVIEVTRMDSCPHCSRVNQEIMKVTTAYIHIKAWKKKNLNLIRK